MLEGSIQTWKVIVPVLILALLSPPASATSSSPQLNQAAATATSANDLQKLSLDDFSNYLNRTLLARDRISSRIFQSFPASFTDILVFTGIGKEELRNISLDRAVAINSSEEILKKYVVDQFILLDHPEYFGAIWNRTTRPVHWLRYDTTHKNQTFRWVRSHGRINHIESHVLGSRDNEVITENDFLADLVKWDNDKGNQPICIAGNPGQGVSTSVYISHIGRKLRQIYPERNVIIIGAAEFVKLVQLRQTEGNGTGLKEAVEIILKDELGMKGDAGMELLLQEFDIFLGGIDDDFAFEVLNVIQSSFGSVRVWVTTDYSSWLDDGQFYAVEQQLGVICTKLEPLSEEQPLAALTKFWSRREELNQTKLDEFARNALKSLDSEGRPEPKDKIEDEEDDISDKSLQAMMLAEVYEDDAVSYSRLNNSSTRMMKSERGGPRIEMINSIADLYQSWVNKKFEDYEMSGSGGAENNGSNIKLTERKLLEMHAGLGLELLFPEEFQKVQHLFGPGPDPEQLEELAKVGILEASSRVTGGQLRFRDPTLAKYFMAWFVSDKLRGEGKWEEKEGKNLTEFILNGILATKRVKLTACLESNSVDNFHPGVGVGTPTNLKVDSFQFLHPTIGYFLNYLLDDIPPTDETHQNHFISNFTRSVDSLGIMNRIARALANSDYLHLLNYFKGLKSFEGNSSSTIFNDEFLCLTIKKSRLDFVKTAMAEFERHHNFTLEEQTGALRLAVRRGHSSIVDFFLEDKGLHKLVEKLNDETELLLYDAVRESQSSSDQEVRDKMKVIQKLVRINGDLLHQNRSVGPPLLERNAHAGLLIQLINLGMDVLGRDNWNNTVLHLPSNSFPAKEYHALLISIPDDKLRELVQIKNGYGRTPLMALVADIEPLPESLERLKQAGADFGLHHPEFILEWAVQYRRSVATLRKLIELGADVKWRGSRGRTLLHLAASAALPETVGFLLEEHGLDVNAEDDQGLTPLNYLLDEGRGLARSFETFLVLEKHGAMYNDTVNSEGRNLLHLAAKLESFNSALILLRLGKVDVNGQDKDGNAPLHLLLKYFGNPKKYLTMTALLLQNGADMSILNNDGESPMEVALKNIEMNFETLQLLNSKTDFKWTPKYATLALVSLARTGNFDGFGFQPLAEGLEKLGADFSYKSSSNDTLLHLAARHGNYWGVRYLVEEKGVNVNATGAYNKAPLYEAAGLWDKGVALKIIKFLIDRGANVYGKDDTSHYYTFLHLYLDDNLGPSASQFHSLTKHLIAHNHTDLFDVVGGWEKVTPYQMALKNKKFDKRTFVLLNSVGVGEEKKTST